MAEQTTNTTTTNAEGTTNTATSTEKQTETVIDLDGFNKSKGTKTDDDKEPTIIELQNQLNEMNEKYGKLKVAFDNKASETADKARKLKEAEKQTIEKTSREQELEKQLAKINQDTAKKDFAYNLADKRKINRSMAEKLVNAIVNDELDGKASLGDFDMAFEEFLTGFEAQVRQSAFEGYKKDFEAGRKPSGFGENVETDPVKSFLANIEKQNKEQAVTGPYFIKK